MTTLLAIIESTPVAIVMTGLGVLLAFYLQLAAVKKNVATDIIRQMKAEQVDASGDKLPQPLDVRMAREFASSEAFGRHATKDHAEHEEIKRRIGESIANFNTAITEVKVHLAAMDERSASNQQTLVMMGERLNKVAEAVAAIGGKKHA